MSARIRIDRAGEDAIEAAVLDGETLLDHAFWRPDRPDGWGDLHFARAGARAAALGGCFVALAPPHGTGFLPDRATANAPPPGDGAPIVVAVTRSAQGGKGPRLALVAGDGGAGGDGDGDGGETGALVASARRDAGAPRLLRRGPTPLAEVVARWPDAPVTVPDPALAAALLPVPVTIDGRPDPAAEAACAALHEPAVALPGGARATIHPTPALVAIDVDTAGAVGTGARPHALLAANRLLLPPLLRELRLRNLSGAILIDLAGLPARKRALLGPDFARLLATDPLRPRWLGFTALGLAEIVRARTRPPLHEHIRREP